MIRTALATAITTLTLVTAAVVPAHAYDPKEYAYAAGHMITPKDIPKPLSVKSSGYFSAGPDDGSFFCRRDGKDINVSGGKTRYSINYNPEGDRQPSVNVSVQQFASSTKAIATFRKITKALTSCAGSASGGDTWVDENGATVTQQWSQLTTTGSVPLVTIVGVPSIFLNQNYQNVTSNEDSPYSSDNYTVYTLVNDVIISTAFFSGSELNISPAQKKAVNQTAFNAVSAWLG